IAEVVSKYGLHEVQNAGDERWVRDKARVQGTALPWFIRRVTSIVKDTAGERSTYEFLENAARKPYAKIQRRVTAKWDELVSMTRADKVEPRWRWLYSLSAAASICDPQSLATLLRLHALPAFFETYPSGRFVFYESNYEYERRYGLLRGMYSLSQYDLADLSA